MARDGGNTELIKLTHRSIRNRWPVTEERRRIAMERVTAILQSTEIERNAIAAAKVLVDADKVNMADAANKIKADEAAREAERPAPVVSIGAVIAIQAADDATHRTARSILAGLVALRGKLPAGPGTAGEPVEVRDAAPLAGDQRSSAGLNGTSH